MMKNLKTNKVTISKKECPILGLKYHLGHTAYLPKMLLEGQSNNQWKAGNSNETTRGLKVSTSPFYLTKSSIAINKLKDMMQIIDNIDFKLKALDKDIEPTNANFVQTQKTTNVGKKYKNKSNRRVIQKRRSQPIINMESRVSDELDMSAQLEDERKHLQRITKENENEVKMNLLDIDENEEFINIISIPNEHSPMQKSKSRFDSNQDFLNLEHLNSGRLSILSNKASIWSKNENDGKPTAENVSSVVATFDKLPPKFRRRYEEMLLIPQSNFFIINFRLRVGGRP